MAEAVAAPPRPLYADESGALPKPWGAFKDPEGSLYYCNLVTCETTWQRPVVHVPRANVYRDPQSGGRPAFAGWRDLPLRELPVKNAAEAFELFRAFCRQLSPSSGVFGRRGDGVLWRMAASERLGVVLYPEQRSLAVAFDPEAQGPTGGGSLSDSERLKAMELVLHGLVARQTPQAALVAPEAHLLRRYAAELGGRGSPGPEVNAPSAEVLPLADYLQRFELIPPFNCTLTGIAGMKSEVELAAHLLSEAHCLRRQHLRSACERLAEIECGEATLCEWLPAQSEKYREILAWCDRRFQDLPMADGRVLRFDHLAGKGAISPASSWARWGHPPPRLVAQVGRDGLQPAVGRGGGIWSTSQDAESVSEGLSSVDDLLKAVRLSLVGPASVPEDAADETLELEPPWQLVRDDRGQVFYHNPHTKEGSWERPPPSRPLVEIGQSWANNPRTRSLDTPQDQYARCHRLAARPQRGVPGT